MATEKLISQISTINRALGMDDGIPDWMGGYSQYKQRMQCYGNAVVPQQFYPIFQAIADIERGFVHG